MFSDAAEPSDDAAAPVPQGHCTFVGYSGEPERQGELAHSNAHGFKSYDAYELILYHSRGDQAEHGLARRFR